MGVWVNNAFGNHKKPFDEEESGCYETSGKRAGLAYETSPEGHEEKPLANPVKDPVRRARLMKLWGKMMSVSTFSVTPFVVNMIVLMKDRTDPPSSLSLVLGFGVGLGLFFDAFCSTCFGRGGSARLYFWRYIFFSVSFGSFCFWCLFWDVFEDPNAFPPKYFGIFAALSVAAEIQACSGCQEFYYDALDTLKSVAPDVKDDTLYGTREVAHILVNLAFLIVISAGFDLKLASIAALMIFFMGVLGIALLDTAKSDLLLNYGADTPIRFPLPDSIKYCFSGPRLGVAAIGASAMVVAILYPGLLLAWNKLCSPAWWVPLCMIIFCLSRHLGHYVVDVVGKKWYVGCFIYGMVQLVTACVVISVFGPIYGKEGLLQDLNPGFCSTAAIAAGFGAGTARYSAMYRTNDDGHAIEHRGERRSYFAMVEASQSIFMVVGYLAGPALCSGFEVLAW